MLVLPLMTVLAAPFGVGPVSPLNAAPAPPGLFARERNPPPLAGPDSPTCYANCDNSTIVPFLNVNDFICYLNLFASGDTRANCDQSSNPPVLNVNDFICYNEVFAAGCSAP